MQKKSDNKTIKIILGDKKLGPIIRSLIEATESFNISDVVGAVECAWEEANPAEELKITPQEECFFLRVDKFFQDYERDILGVYHRMVEYKSKEKEQEILGQLKIFVYAGYCNFERDKTVTLNMISKYGIELFGLEKKRTYGREVSQVIIQFFSRLSYPTDHTKPYYTVNKIPYDNCLNFIQGHKDFLNKYSCRRTETVEAILTVIWFIREYYY